MSLITVHLHDKFDWIGRRRMRRKYHAADLQITPVQRTVDTIKDENYAPFRSFDPYLHETLEEGCVVEIEKAG